MNKKDKLDKVFSEYIREKGSINKYNTCFTCGKVLPISELHCGHFLSRRYLAIRWNVLNAKPQCRDCNVFKNGNEKIFKKRLRQEYGNGVIADLEFQKHKIVKLTDEDYKEKIKFFKNKIKEL